MYKVMIAEDEDIIRKGLVYSIPWVDMGCSVISEVRNGIEGIEKIKENQPDIVIVDINMPVMDGIEAATIAQKLYPDLKIITLSMYGEEDYYYKMVNAGVMGFVLKNSDIK